MSIDTLVPGDPASVATAARWLTGSLQGALEGAADSLREAEPAAGWQGRSADAFASWSATSAETTDKVARRVDRAGADLTAYAAALRRGQADMRTIRAEARSAGLAVDGHVVVDPSVGPADPGRLPSPQKGLRIPLATLTRHAEAVAAHEAHQALVLAYRTAEEDAAAVRDDVAEAAARLQDGYDRLKSLGWITHGLGILTGATAVAEQPPTPGWSGGEVGWVGGVEAVTMPHVDADPAAVGAGSRPLLR